jgi:hypothetical protein
MTRIRAGSGFDFSSGTIRCILAGRKITLATSNGSAEWHRCHRRNDSCPGARSRTSTGSQSRAGIRSVDWTACSSIPTRRSSGTSDGPGRPIHWCARGALSRWPPCFSWGLFLPAEPHSWIVLLSRGPALLLPQDGIRGFGRPISLRVIHSGERSQEACRTGRCRRPGCGRAESG